MEAVEGLAGTRVSGPSSRLWERLRNDFILYPCSELSISDIYKSGLPVL